MPPEGQIKGRKRSKEIKNGEIRNFDDGKKI